MIIERCHLCVGNSACENQVVNECIPVGAFGRINDKSVKVATIGLNPASTEFATFDFNKPKERNQRLAMLADYNLTNRTDLLDKDVADAKNRRENYFTDGERDCHSYFQKLESVISRIQPAWSYLTGRIVHIDLVACTTKERWGKLGQDCKSNLVKNCRPHFLSALNELPNGTLLLLDGSRAVDEMHQIGKLANGVSFELEHQGYFSPLIENRSYIGSLKYNGKLFPFRGWSIPVGVLTLLYRYDLAASLCKTFSPPLDFLPATRLPQ